MPRIEFEHLSPRERLELIEALWESLEGAEIPPTPAQIEELDRRIATADADLSESSSWETMRAEAANRYR
ncbi:MAG TPA: addiction module protein [Candidatus Omnitrophota bacterium]|nr:addiction module protein [Candidatus Omnitrophota bacterium]